MSNIQKNKTEDEPDKHEEQIRSTGNRHDRETGTGEEKQKQDGRTRAGGTPAKKTNEL